MTIVTVRLCEIPDCGRKWFAREWCKTHYVRWWKTGDVQADRPVGGYTSNEAWCPACSQLKPLTSFDKRTSSSRGVKSYCKVCFAAKAQSVYRDKNLAYKKKWRQSHPEAIRRWARAGERARRVRLREAAGRATLAQVQARWDFYGGRCWMCRDPATQMDHVKPLAAGGSGWAANLRPACAPCNLLKRAKWPFDVEEFRGRRAA